MKENFNLTPSRRDLLTGAGVLGGLVFLAACSGNKQPMTTPTESAPATTSATEVPTSTETPTPTKMPTPTESSTPALEAFPTKKIIIDEQTRENFEKWYGLTPDQCLDTIINWLKKNDFCKEPMPEIIEGDGTSDLAFTLTKRLVYEEFYPAAALYKQGVDKEDKDDKDDKAGKDEKKYAERAMMTFTSSGGYNNSGRGGYNGIFQDMRDIEETGSPKLYEIIDATDIGRYKENPKYPGFFVNLRVIGEEGGETPYRQTFVVIKDKLVRAELCYPDAAPYDGTYAAFHPYTESTQA